MGALEVKKRSEAFFSTISLNSGLVLRVGCPPPVVKVSPGAIPTGAIAAAAIVVWGPVALSFGSTGGFAGPVSLTGVVLDSMDYCPQALQRAALVFLDDLQRTAVVNRLGLAL